MMKNNEGCGSSETEIRPISRSINYLSTIYTWRLWK